MDGAATPKRQYAWSNSTAIRRLDIGWRRMKPQVKTVKHYFNKDGKKCYQGTKHLRDTEILGLIETFWLSFGTKIQDAFTASGLYSLPRIYPVPFAECIVALRQDLIENRPMDVTIPAPCPLGPEILAGTPEDTEGLFAKADLKGVYKYLRGGKGLQLPTHWYSQMPHEVQ